MISGPEAIHRIEQNFPQLLVAMHDEVIEGLLHLQIAEFSRLTQSFIDNGEPHSFDRACQLFLELFEQGSPELVNALNVSFLENLTIDRENANCQQAFHRMPPRMRSAWREMEEHNRRIHGDE